MRRRFAALISVLALGAAVAVPTAAAADFPEQPGDNVAQGCQAVIAHNTSLQHSSPVAGQILTGLLQDACFGG